MNSKLLELIPTKYLCPYCECWHEYPTEKNLEYYDTSFCSINLSCPYFRNDESRLQVHFADDRCYWKKDDWEDSCKISDFSEIGEFRVKTTKQVELKLGFEFKPEEYSKQILKKQLVKKRHYRIERVSWFLEKDSLRKKKMFSSQEKLCCRQKRLKLRKKRRKILYLRLLVSRSRFMSILRKKMLNLLRNSLKSIRGLWNG